MRPTAPPPSLPPPVPPRAPSTIPFAAVAPAMTASPAQPPAQSPAESPPSAQHLAQIEEARRRVRPIRRAAAMASFNGWTLAAFAVITLLSSLTSVWGIIGGLALAAVAHFELRGAKELRRLDRDGPVRLAWNQLALGVLLVTYAAVSIYAAQFGPSVYAQTTASDPQLANMLAPFDSLTRSITMMVYVVVGIVGVLAPGLTALFYLRRRRMIDQYLQQTPPWITNLQRMGSTI